jgi:N-methylhydantoinase B
MTAVISPGTGAYAPGSIGAFGGYPGSSTEHRVFRKGNIADRPTSLETTRGETTEDVRASAVPVSTEDILYIRPDGGGGYGDPLDRDPALVAEDVLLGIVSLEGARRVYGVVLDDPVAGADSDATARERRGIRERRLGATLRVEVAQRRDVPRTPFRINEYLQLSADRSHVQCTWCGESVCDSSTHWKDAAVRSDEPFTPTEQPPDGEEYILRSFFCPACGTAFEVEGCRSDDEPLRDSIREWPKVSNDASMSG